MNELAQHFLIAQDFPIRLSCGYVKERQRETNKLKARPSGKVQQLFEEVANLPRRQQDKVVEFVSAFVRQQQSAK